MIRPFLRCRLNRRVPDQRVGVVSRSKGVVLREAVLNERVFAVAAAAGVASLCRSWSGGFGLVSRTGCYMGREIINRVSERQWRKYRPVPVTAGVPSLASV